jgi:hypothetical protein
MIGVKGKNMPSLMIAGMAVAVITFGRACPGLGGEI